MSTDIYAIVFDAINLIRVDIMGKLKNTPSTPINYPDKFWTDTFIRLVTEQPDKFQEIHDMLEDDDSKGVYISDIKNRVLQSYFSSFLSDEIANNYYSAKEHRMDLIDYKSNLEAFHSDFSAGDVLTFVKKQYTIPDLFEPNAGDIIFDIGSFNGGTAVFFSKYVGDNGKVYSFEPLPEYFERAKLNTNQYENIECVNMGFSNKKSKVSFNNNGACASKDYSGTIECELSTIDEFVSDKQIKVDMIKMDIEGEEIKALYGAVKTIKKFKPKLAICIYHNAGEDMLTIPLALKKLNIGYKFYIRKYHMSIQETVLFATVENY